MNSCSLIIRAFNEEQHIGRLLAGVQQQENVAVEAILVDSGSTDATVSIAQSFGAKIVSIPPQEFTFGRSLNLGCSHATNEILVFASAHVYPVYRDWLRRLISSFTRPEVGLSYGRQIGNEVTRYSEHRILEKWFPGESDNNQSHPFCNNANAAVREDLWKSYRYDESLTGLEDLDFANRILRDGHKVVYRADAPIVHVHQESPTQIHNRFRREAIALRQIMPGEKMSVIDLARLFFGNTVSDLVHAAYERKLIRNLASIPTFRLMQFTGAYRGFRQRGPVGTALRNRFYYSHGLTRTATVTAQ